MARLTRSQKRAIYAEAAVHESPEFDREGMETLAGAICLFAAGAHSTNVANQEQIAATFFNCAITGFEGVRADEAVQCFVQSMMDKAKKK